MTRHTVYGDLGNKEKFNGKVETLTARLFTAVDLKQAFTASYDKYGLTEEVKENLNKLYEESLELEKVTFPGDLTQYGQVAEDYYCLRRFRIDFGSYLRGDLRMNGLLNAMSHAYVYAYTKFKNSSPVLENLELNSYFAESNEITITKTSQLINQTRVSLKRLDGVSDYSLANLAKFIVFNHIVKNIDNVIKYGDSDIKKLCIDITKDDRRFIKGDVPKYKYIKHLLSCWTTVRVQLASERRESLASISSGIHAEDKVTDTFLPINTPDTSIEVISSELQNLLKQKANVNDLESATVEFINDSLEHTIKYALMMNNGK